MGNHNAADLVAHYLWVTVEGGDDVEALWLESAVFRDSLAEPADADQAHAPILVEAEDLAQSRQEAHDVVAAALLAETAEIAEVLADLRGRDIELFAQRLRTHD